MRMFVFPSEFIAGGAEFKISAYLTDWTIEKSPSGTSKLSRSFEFKTFEDCIRFMSLLTEDIQALDHHPNWTNSYNQLHVTLTTWDTDSVISLKDYKLAYIIDCQFNRFYQS